MLAFMRIVRMVPCFLQLSVEILEGNLSTGSWRSWLSICMESGVKLREEYGVIRKTGCK